MSRSGYNDDCDDQWDFIRWRGAVTSAMRGKRGQAFLAEMIAALDALPEKKLIADELEEEGAVCAIGAVGKARGVDMTDVDAHDSTTVAALFSIPHAMACEIVYVNDDHFAGKTPEARFAAMRSWAKDQIWNARGCVADPYGKQALYNSKRPHWGTVIEWDEV